MNLLANLESFNNDQKIITYNQSTTDIINAIIKQHQRDLREYDKLFYFFNEGNFNATAKKVFNYLKNNIKYVIEPDHLQTVKTPSAILATGKTTGSDCKNYSLFFAGVLDAVRRNTGENFDLSYRFASYDGSNVPEHVFVVINPGSENEIWCDAVLNNFNQKKQPNYYKDKKIKNMALMALSGVNTQPKMDGVLDIVQGASGLIPGGQSVASLVGLVSGLFAGHSDSYLLDHAIMDSDWNKAMGIFFTWYQTVGFDQTKKPWSKIGKDQGVTVGVPQPFASVPRYEWMPLIWQKTQNKDLAILINEAIKQGKLDKKYFINSKGVMAPESSLLTSLFGGGASSTTPGAPGASSGISTPLIIGGVAAAAVIGFLIFKKK